jgi:hypothetical protein
MLEIKIELPVSKYRSITAKLQENPPDYTNLIWMCLVVSPDELNLADAPLRVEILRT